jgi:hypothetical protein
VSFAVRLIIDEVARETGIPADVILSEMRTAKVSDARALAAYVTREVTLWSWSRIGRAFEKDHTSIITAYRKIEKSLASDHELAQVAEGLISRLKLAHRQQFRPHVRDVVELAGPIAAGSLRAAIGTSARDVKRLASGVMDLWDIALAAEVFVHHIEQSRAITSEEDRKFAENLGRAITETVDELRNAPQPEALKETA